jgi:opacity protein-like surface antigen
MRKLLLSIALLVFLGAPALALDFDARSFYAQGTFSLPTGDFGDFAGNGFGGAIGIRVPHNEQLSFRGEAGYIFFQGQEFGAGDFKADYSYSMIPIVALAQYFFTPEAMFYGLGGAGFYNVRFDVDYATETFGVADFDDSSTEFGITLGGGYTVNEQISVEARYNIISDADQLTINGIFNF